MSNDGIASGDGNRAVPYGKSDVIDRAALYARPAGGRCPVELQLKLRLDELRVLDPEPRAALRNVDDGALAVAKPPSTVIHAGWLVLRRAGRVFLPNSDMGQVSPPVKRAAETLVADANNLNE